jgi:hypothetical protein
MKPMSAEGMYRGAKWGQTWLFLYFYFASLDQILFQTHEFLSESILLLHALFHLRDPLAQRNRITPKKIGHPTQRVARKLSAQVSHNTASRSSFPIPAHAPYHASRHPKTHFNPTHYITKGKVIDMLNLFVSLPAESYPRTLPTPENAYPPPCRTLLGAHPPYGSAHTAHMPEPLSPGSPKIDPERTPRPQFPFSPRSGTSHSSSIGIPWDADLPPYMAHAIFANLKNTPVKRMVMIGEETHWVLIEKNRRQLFREVQLFLEEPK